MYIHIYTRIYMRCGPACLQGSLGEWGWYVWKKSWAASHFKSSLRWIHLCSKPKTNWRILPPISGDIGDSLLNDNVGLPTPGETSIEDRHVTCQVKFKSSGLWGPQAVRWMSKCGLLLSPTHGQGWYTWLDMTNIRLITKSKIITIWLFNIAMENQHFQ